MNLIALISAVIGVLLLMFVVLFGNKLANRWLRYFAIVVGISIALAITGSVPVLFGDTDLSTSSKAGEYLLYLGILFAGIKSIFFKNKKLASSSHKDYYKMEDHGMARADKCIMEGKEITVEKALIIRDTSPSGRRKSLGFSCIECGKAVRPHKAGGNGSAHFEHLERNPQCQLSDPFR